MEKIKKLEIIVKELLLSSTNRAKEHNFLVYSYIKNSLYLLRKYMINPFTESFKVKVYEEAKKNSNLNERGLIKEKISLEEILGNKKLVATITLGFKHNYKAILDETEGFLNKLNENPNQYCKRINQEVFVEVEYLLNKLREMQEKNKIEFNRYDLNWVDREGKLIISEANKFVLNFEKNYSKINKTNLEEFFKAKGVEYKLKKLGDVFKDWFFSLNLIEGEEIYDLKNCLVLIKFWNEEKIDWRGVFKEIAQKETINLTSTTGDLILLKETFGLPYEYHKGDSKIRVEFMEIKGKKTLINKVTLTKERKGKKLKTTYNLFRQNNEIYISIESLFRNIKQIELAYKTIEPKFEIEFLTKSF